MVGRDPVPGETGGVGGTWSGIKGRGSNLWSQEPVCPLVCSWANGQWRLPFVCGWRDGQDAAAQGLQSWDRRWEHRALWALGWRVLFLDGRAELGRGAQQGGRGRGKPLDPPCSQGNEPLGRAETPQEHLAGDQSQILPKIKQDVDGTEFFKNGRTE